MNNVNFKQIFATCFVSYFLTMFLSILIPKEYIAHIVTGQLTWFIIFCFIFYLAFLCIGKYNKNEKQRKRKKKLKYYKKLLKPKQMLKFRKQLIEMDLNDFLNYYAHVPYPVSSLLQICVNETIKNYFRTNEDKYTYGIKIKNTQLYQKYLFIDENGVFSKKPVSESLSISFDKSGTLVTLVHSHKAELKKNINLYSSKNNID